eukprot:CAMPEP_0172554346 /NCGR_PEP_ID=MMETSP1067-20121228/54133_1 /TAXON_ID=265564 ORGANISM="Thalassiosira punctigera, Strain Tpunct2005C2" /NCGR_SAMPLE_ID=MMETSP1067 /ASSEMBLY_ACC=CAM_ASM_000444 /LENGTH=76 /DNA_ID=CAMNT_0013342697 /DNA_START=134 /DNA_END=364 /DNA_ORIENTATION=-
MPTPFVGVDVVAQEAVPCAMMHEKKPVKTILKTQVFWTIVMNPSIQMNAPNRRRDGAPGTSVEPALVFLVLAWIQV